MKLILTCPNCGGKDWFKPDEDSQFICNSCGKEAVKDEMNLAFQGTNWNKRSLSEDLENI